MIVALFTRAWIEIASSARAVRDCPVALFTRAWIEMSILTSFLVLPRVALFTSAWIEISFMLISNLKVVCRPLHEGVD